MDKEHVKGAADKAKGAMKDAAGKMIATRDCRLKGRWTGPREKPAKLSATPRTQLNTCASSTRP